MLKWILAFIAAFLLFDVPQFINFLVLDNFFGLKLIGSALLILVGFDYIFDLEFLFQKPKRGWPK